MRDVRRLQPWLATGCLLFTLALLLPSALIGAQSTPSPRPRDARSPAPAAVTASDPSASAASIVIAEYDGIIHPIAAEFLDDVLKRANDSNARLAVLLLRTPGGLVDSTRGMVARMIASRVPIVVFIAPSGARAASAGFLLTIAADVAVMAPGTNIGAATPVNADGGEAGGNATMAKKAAEDVAAFARTLAQARGRNTTLAAEAVTASRAFTEREALEADPPLIDFIATDVDDILRQLDGRTIRRFDGSTVTLDTSDASSVTRDMVEMSRRQQLLSAIANPQIAYLLFSLGTLGLFIELWNPGSIAPGVAGGLCLLLAFFAFQIVPVNVAGLLLIVFGLVMLLLELKVPSFGALGVGGTIALFIGSIMVTREVPGVQVSYSFIVPVVLTMAGLFLLLGRLALQAQRLVSVSGVDAMVGQGGIALTEIHPGGDGQIRLRGEIWRAASPMPVAPGQRVRVVAVNGLTVPVQPSVDGEPKES